MPTLWLWLTPPLAMLATAGALLVQEKATPLTLLPLESCAVAENVWNWSTATDAVFGVTVMVATVVVAVVADVPPPQPVSTTLSKYNPANGRVVLPTMNSDFSRKLNDLLLALVCRTHNERVRIQPWIADKVVGWCAVQE